MVMIIMPMEMAFCTALKRTDMGMGLDVFAPRTPRMDASKMT